MLLEAAQVLCTAAGTNGLEAEFLYRATHVDHPVTKWAAESRANWLRLREHAAALNAEFVARYEEDDDHASGTVIERIDPDAIGFPAADPTLRPQAMPDRYRRPGDPVDAYRPDYATEKAPGAGGNTRNGLRGSARTRSRKAPLRTTRRSRPRGCSVPSIRAD